MCGKFVSSHFSGFATLDSCYTYSEGCDYEKYSWLIVLLVQETGFRFKDNKTTLISNC